MSDKMREEFEAWFQSAFNFETASMRFAMREVMFEAWQASRAALCVNLPKQWFDDDHDCDLMEAHKVGKALDAAGVRYK